MPPLLRLTHPDYAHSMDVVFATYWFYPAKTTILLPEDEACVKAKMDKEKQRFDPQSKSSQCSPMFKNIILSLHHGKTFCHWPVFFTADSVVSSPFDFILEKYSN